MTAAIAAVSLRSIRGVVLPLYATGLGSAMTLVAFTAFGNAFNFVTAIAPPVVFIIGFAFAMHVVTEFDRRFTVASEKTAAAKRTLDEVFTPLTLTAFTTSVGFASLATSPIDSIRTFGIYAAAGTSMCWFMALLIIPAAFVSLPMRVGRQAGQSWLVRKASALAHFDLRHRRLILLSGALVAALAIIAAQRIEVNTDYLTNFKQGSELRTDFDHLRDRFGGAIPVQIVFESSIQNAFTDPIQLQALADFEAWLEMQVEIGMVASVIDFISVLHPAITETPRTNTSLPATRGEIEDIFFLAGSDEARRFVDKRFTATVMHVRTESVASRDLAKLIARIEEKLRELPGSLQGRVTGSSALLARTLDDIVYGQLLSLAGALAVIYAVLVVLFGSMRVGGLALIPNILPIIYFFGLLGLTGITLNLVTSLVAAVILGIAVDDTMHFLSRFNHEARRVASEREGIEAALAAVIRPVTFTTAALCCGFLTLTMGDLQSQVEFGTLAAVTLFIAWFIDLVFTPALAGQLRFVTLWEVLSLDLGEAPHKTIPLFSGLSNREARIAAILGTLKSFESGEAIIKIGDRARDIHLVIEGRAKAYIVSEGRQQILRELRRGDLVGEVALFSGVRSANVEATTPMRLLHLSDRCLERIQSRYPRIAAQLYRNLGRTLAGRLSDLTGRL